jgi:long-subunit acyl-CoA synthetase (AMP-forming)
VQQVQYIINHANVKAIIAEKKSLQAILEAKDRCPTLKYIILMDDEVVDKQFIKEHHNDSQPLFTHTMSQIEQIGSKHPVGDVLPAYDDLVSNRNCVVTYVVINSAVSFLLLYAVVDMWNVLLMTIMLNSSTIPMQLTICYTSGTTGNPKGVVLTHGNILSTAASISSRSPAHMHTGDHILFSYLPLAHIYERVVEASLILEGNALGFSQGDNTKLVEDVQELKPTIFPGVPRVWQRIYDRVNAQVQESGKIKAALVNHAYAVKLKQLHEGEEYPGSSVWGKSLHSSLHNNSHRPQSHHTYDTHILVRLTHNLALQR